MLAAVVRSDELPPPTPPEVGATGDLGGVAKVEVVLPGGSMRVEARASMGGGGARTLSCEAGIRMGFLASSSSHPQTTPGAHTAICEMISAINLTDWEEVMLG